jgi:release factor glutamine methyltransferase
MADARFGSTPAADGSGASTEWCDEALVATMSSAHPPPNRAGPAAGWKHATNWELHALLPATVSLETTLATHDVSQTNAMGTVYHWNGWTFDVPPGVFEPGATNRFLCGLMLDGTLPLEGLRYAAMGAGLGVEAVVAGVRGARHVHALDVHEESVRAATLHYDRIVGRRGPPFVGIVSDLWERLPEDTKLDVVTFNPPLIDIKLSDDPYIVRNRCMGLGLAERFFEQVRARRLLDPDGVVYLTITNTSPLRDVVAMALHAGFDLEALAVRDWSVDGVQTFLIALREAVRR